MKPKSHKITSNKDPPILYKNHLITNLPLIRGTKILSLTQICNQLSIPRPTDKKQKENLIKFLKQRYIITQETSQTYKITKIPKNIQTNLKKQNKYKQKPELIITNSNKIVNKNHTKHQEFYKYLDYFLLNTTANTMTEIIIELFKHILFFQKYLLKNKTNSFSYPKIARIVHRVYLQDLYLIVYNALRRIELKKLAKVIYYYTFTKQNGEMYSEPIKNCTYIEEQVLKEMNLSSTSKLTSKELQSEFYWRLSNLTGNKSCRKTLKIMPIENIDKEYTEEEIQEIYNIFLEGYREKIENKIKPIERFLLSADKKQQILNCAKELEALFIY